MLVNSITQSCPAMNLQTLPDADADLLSFLEGIEQKKDVDAADIAQFSRYLENMDLNGYIEEEEFKFGILRSALILSFTLNAEIKNTEPLIDAVLAHNPNLDLPIIILLDRDAASNDPKVPSLLDFLRQMREETSSTSNDIAFNRVDRILDYAKNR